MSFSRQHIAIFLALLFHVCGFAGIVFTPYRDWFIQNTPLNLCLMAILLIWTQEEKNLAFCLFSVIAFLVGMGAEMIGVNTGRLFGSYTYGTVLGPKFNGVPWLIGINWFVVLFCASATMHQLLLWLSKQALKAGAYLPPRVKIFSFLIDGALIATLFDWLMEPVAAKLGYWQWTNTEVPFFNYICWFIISLVLLMLMRVMRFTKHNYFAVQLLIIQVLFFAGLRICLL